MPKIGKQKSFEEIKCDRCGSPQKISKTWTQKIKNDHGTMILEHKQIICTNKVCQREFDDVIKKEADKREKLKQIKLEDAAGREALKLAENAKKNAKISKVATS